MIPGDPSCYPRTDVMINNFDIRDGDTARAVEYKFASVRQLELEAKPLDGKFDFEHLQAIHGHLFQDMYEWAGKVRKIDFAKRNVHTGMVNKFVPESVMQFKVEDFNAFIAEKNQLKGLTKPEFVKAITEVHTKLNELHPFREGNGRSTRVFLSQLARNVGFELNMEKIEKDRWNLASHKAQVQHHPREPGVKVPGNQSEMRQIFHESLTPTIEHSFRHEARETATARYPDLKPVFERLDAIVAYTTKMPDREAAERLVAAEKTRIADKLFNSATAAERAKAEIKLLDVRSGTTGVKPLTGAKDEYEIVATVMADVLKSKGYSAQAIERSMAEATRRLDAMREAGKPAPVIDRDSAGQRREASRPPPGTVENRERKGPSLER